MKVILFVLEEDVVKYGNEFIELIDFVRNFVVEIDKIELIGKLKGKFIFVEDMDFGWLIGIIEKENKVVFVVIEIDVEIYFCFFYNRYENLNLFFSII